MRDQPALAPLASTLRAAAAQMNHGDTAGAKRTLLNAAKQSHFAALRAGDINLRHASFALHYHADLLNDADMSGRHDLPDRPAAAAAAAALRKAMASGQKDVAYPGHGQMGETSFVSFSDGSRWVRKGDAAVDQDREILAARVSDALGANAPEVIPDPDKANWSPGNAHPVVWEPMLPYSTAIDLERGKDYEPAKIFSSQAGQKIGLLDKITSNQDRNDGNWLIDENGNPLPIDHGQAYFDNDYAPSSEFSQNLDLSAVPQSQWDVWQQNLTALEPDFAALNHSDWYASMMQAFNQVRPA